MARTPKTVAEPMGLANIQGVMTLVSMAKSRDRWGWRWQIRRETEPFDPIGRFLPSSLTVEARWGRVRNPTSVNTLIGL